MARAAHWSRGTVLVAALGTLAFLLPLRTVWPESRTFLRGDIDGSGAVNISDAVELLRALFVEASDIACLDAADVDDDGALNLTDAAFLFRHLFSGGPRPLAPFPEPGTDPSPDTLDRIGARCGVGPDNPVLLRPGTSSIAVSGDGLIVAYVTALQLLVERWTTREILLERDHRFEVLSAVEAEVLLEDLRGRGVLVHPGICSAVPDETRVMVGVDYLHPSLSADGTRLAYELRTWVRRREAVFQYSSVHVLDLAEGSSRVVSISSSGEEADATSVVPRISGDGESVVFLSRASNLAQNGTDQRFHVYVHDLVARNTELVSVSPRGFPAIPRRAETPPMRPDISFDGKRIVFATNALGLDHAEQNPRAFPAVYLRDRRTGSTTLVSGAPDGRLVDGPSFVPRISDDGRWVIFLSAATGLLEGDDVASRYRAYVYDAAAGRAVDVLRDPATGKTGYPGDLSADGARIVFDVRCDRCARRHAYLLDRTTGMTTIISTSADGHLGNDPSWDPIISRDGRFVAFSTSARNLFASGQPGSCMRFVSR